MDACRGPDAFASLEWCCGMRSGARDDRIACLQCGRDAGQPVHPDLATLNLLWHVVRVATSFYALWTL